MSKKFYVVPAIKTEHKARMRWANIEVEETLKIEWADGMFGAMPVFTNKRKAEKYAGPKLRHKIIVFEKEGDDAKR